MLEYSEKLYQIAKQAALLAKEHEKYDTLVPEEEPTVETDTEDGLIKEKHQVEVEVNAGETTTVEASVIATPTG